MARRHLVRKQGRAISCSFISIVKLCMNHWGLFLLLFHGTTVCLRVFHKQFYSDGSLALHNAWSPILAALFAGNSIVLKCSENVLWSTGWFVDIIKSCLRACGHDEELVQVVCCWPEQAEALTKSPIIKHITFIGSEEVGRKVSRDVCLYEFRRNSIKSGCSSGDRASDPCYPRAWRKGPSNRSSWH